MGLTISVGSTKDTTADRHVLIGANRSARGADILAVGLARPTHKGCTFLELRKELTNLRIETQQWSSSWPEVRRHQVSPADAIILIGGETGTREIAVIAQESKKPTLALGAAGGISQEVFDWFADNLRKYEVTDDELATLKRAWDTTLVAELVRRIVGDHGRPYSNAAASDRESGTIRDQVFISYSHKDKEWMESLLTHLKPLIRTGGVKAWADTQIRRGSQWFDEIQNALSTTKVAVFLVTPDFLASDFIWDNELSPLLADAERSLVTILWVPVRASNVEETSLSKYQAASNPAKPLATMKAEQDQAWVEISKAIRDALNP